MLILWAPDTAENRRIVEAVSRVFDDLKSPPLVKRATEATVADITASEIVLFGVEKTGTTELPAEFGEWLRVFKGITLAGRTAGFFSMGSERATARLRRALKETEIAQREEDPLFVDSKQGDMTEWARKLIGAHREMKHARA